MPMTFHGPLSQRFLPAALDVENIPSARCCSHPPLPDHTRLAANVTAYVCPMILTAPGTKQSLRPLNISCCTVHASTRIV